ncbi:MAG: FKBP-type peptidyl-prolyl cis-trans isomerase [Phycisphaerales bacterium JB050]
MIPLSIPVRSVLLAIAVLSLGACKQEVSPPAPAHAALTIEDHATRPAPDDAERVVLPVELDSGQTVEVVYAVLRGAPDGDAPMAGPEDAITIRFAAGLDRGPAGIEIYDSTDLRQRDFSFSLGDSGVIRGLREAIPGMRVGELRRIEIPWRLAYGENGRGEIPPSTDLVFVVELVSID